MFQNFGIYFYFFIIIYTHQTFQPTAGHATQKFRMGQDKAVHSKPYHLTVIKAT